MQHPPVAITGFIKKNQKKQKAFRVPMYFYVWCVFKIEVELCPTWHLTLKTFAVDTKVGASALLLQVEEDL